MLYRLEMGKIEKTIFDHHERSKEPLPPKVEGAPQIQLGLELYWNGFAALNTCRGSMYNSEGPVPWTAMLAYCEQYEIYGDQREDFFYIMALMDEAYLTFKAKKLEAK